MDHRWRWLAVAVAGCLEFGCGGDEAAGKRPEDAVPTGVVSPIPVQLSWISFEIHSALVGQSWGSPGYPGAYDLWLLEDDGGCGAIPTFRVGRGQHVVSVSVPGLSDGSCAPGDPCDAYVELLPGAGTGFPSPWVPARSATLTLSEPFAGRGLVGELRASFPRDPEVVAEYEVDTSGDGYMLCIAPDGRTRYCDLAPGTSDCCNDGKPLDELAIPFEATPCPEAITCVLDRPCGGEAAAGCDAPATPTDCDLACGHLVDLCAEAMPCEEGDSFCEEFRDRQCAGVGEDCPARCAATSTFPVIGTAFTCLESSGTAEAWNTCMASCGGDR
jgi:hypothetical protein